MATDVLLQELLLQWEECQGTISTEELCRDCPELRPELEKRIAALRDMEWLAKESSGAEEDRPPLSPSLQAGTEAVPGYRLVKRLGRGGFGEVWEAAGPGGFAVALKFIPLGGHRAPLEQRALEIVKELKHSHLLTVFGAWETAEFLAIAMERAERTVHDRWQECLQQGEKGLPATEALGCLREAASALDYLHETKQVQHRDVKPQNLLLVGGTVKLGDFGLARILAHATTGHTGSFTLAYAPPEFFDGRTSVHSDQYSLAVTYCLLRGGKLPFEGTAAALTNAHLRKSPDLTMLPKGERPAVRRALAKRPQDRWPTCAAFVEAVEKQQRGPWLTRRRVLAASVTGLAAGAWLSRDSLLPSPVLPLPVEPPGAPIIIVPPASLKFIRKFDMPPTLPANRRNVRRVSAAVHSVYRGQRRFYVLSSGTSGAILWDGDTGKMLHHLTTHMGVGAVLPDGEHLYGITGHENVDAQGNAATGGPVIQWNLETGKENLRYVGHTGTVNSVALSWDNSRVLTGGDYTVRLWERKTGTLLQTLRGHTGYVVDVAMARTGRHALSISTDGTMRQWDLETGQMTRRFTEHTGRLFAVDISFTGQLAASGGEDNTVIVWDLQSGRPLKRFQHDGMVWDVAFDGTNRYLFSASNDHWLRIWDITSGQIVKQARHDHHMVLSVFPSTNNSPHVFTGTEEGLYQWE